MNKKALKFDYHDFNTAKMTSILSRFGDSQSLKIGYFSTYRVDYTRTEYLLKLFEEMSVNYELITSDKKGLFKYIFALLKLILTCNQYDVIYVAFRGHEILPFVKLIYPNKPIIFDAFISVYDTMCFDRKIYPPFSVIGKLLKRYDKFLCNLSNLVLVDTKTHAKYFSKEFQCTNIDFLYVGCNREMFSSQNKKRTSKKYKVFWYGYGNPLQGLDVILKAAQLLEKTKEIEFNIVGPVHNKYKHLINSLNLKNVNFLGPIAYKKLPKLISEADLCLAGHFSNLSKAKRVIPGKAFQFYEMEKKLILGDVPANKELFYEKGNVTYCKVNNPYDLAKKIEEIYLLNEKK